MHAQSLQRKQKHFNPTTDRQGELTSRMYMKIKYADITEPSQTMTIFQNLSYYGYRHAFTVGSKYMVVYGNIL